MKWFSGLLIFTGALAGHCLGNTLTLTDNHQTPYVVIANRQPGTVDALAVDELVKFLQEATGASFAVVSPDDPRALTSPKRIIVGQSPLAEQLLGKEMIAGLKDQEAWVKTKGDDVALIGGGRQGTLYAVYSFLENELGCRWYTVHGNNLIPQTAKLAIPELDRRERPAFTFRHLTNYFYSMPEKNRFLCRNRMNFGLENGQSFTTLIELYPSLNPNVHSLFYYVCPGEKTSPSFESFLPLPTNYFKTHPEFFSLDKNGRRVDNQQLCFSNKELRAVFTANLLNRLKTGGGKGVVSVSANDVPGSFCQCPDCLALEKKYRCIGGPLFDFLIELCPAVAKVYPDAYVSTLAYRKDQTETPPDVKKLPANLMIVFAPIDDNFAATLDHPTNQGTLANLRRWTAIANHVLVWYYTNPYGQDLPPIGNIERLATDVKLMKQAGVSGMVFEHDAGVPNRNFAELQTWLLLKLFQNPELDPHALTKEFTDFQYGPAAPLVRQYLAELERLRQQMQTPISWCPSLGMYTYLTPENLLRWQTLFDQMEAAAHNTPYLKNVARLRMSLDLVTLDRWRELHAKFPGSGLTVPLLKNRIRKQSEAELAGTPVANQAAARKSMGDLLELKVLLATVTLKPLPAPLDRVPPAKIRQAFPLTGLENDPAAALGLCRKTVTDEMPLTAGIYDGLNRRWLGSMTIPKDQITPGRYQLYKLGQTILTPDCCLWVTQSWFAVIQLEQFYVMGDPLKTWDVYVSLKMDSPDAQPSSGAPVKNTVSCDRVILVECQP